MLYLVLLLLVDMRESASKDLKDPSVFMAVFKRFQNEYQPLRDKQRAEEKCKAPSFNIFNILGVARREVGTHSRFLATLFDPKGVHGQQTLFLKAFLEYCQKHLSEFPWETTNSLESSDWNIQTERRISQYGNLDIVIECPSLGFICVIENKVDAGEQPQQVARYRQWLDKQEKEYPFSALLYLTPTGSQSHTSGEYGYYPLSYNKDVAQWLGQTLAHIEAMHVRETVYQYQQLVKTL
ncbi:MAG: PD-(D/E)XK nuclease family protein [Anaerolineales bacterium]|nr:PD-(D/E)XK nuclease family protein [Anaerolineales bacterium]